MQTAIPGSPQPLAPEVIEKAIKVLEHEPQIAQALARCTLYGKRGGRSGLSQAFFEPLQVTAVAPAELLPTLTEPEYTGRIRQAIDRGLTPPLVVAELRFWADSSSEESS
jgi:hypothetical protein